MTRLRAGVVIGPSGLPRPAVQRGGQLRQRFLLKQVGLDTSSLPLGLQHLLLGPPRVLSQSDRLRLAVALVARGLDARQFGLVLNVIGDAPHSDAQLAELVLEAERQRERELRPGANFSLLGIQGHQGQRLVVRLRTDGPPERELDIAFTLGELSSLARFRSACMRRANFQPVFKVYVTPQAFQRELAVLFDQFRGELDA
jgi:hypothetical protein